MSHQFNRRASHAVAIVFAASAMLAPIARATTVNYTFTQGGFVDGAGNQGALTGIFSGTPEANGTIQLPDLTSFSATFSETVAGQPNSFIFNVPTAFSFDPNTPGSLDFASGSAAIGIQLCSGGNSTNFICFNLSPGGPVRANASGYFMDLPNFGVSITQMGPLAVQVAGSAVPEPSTRILFVTAASVLLTAALIRRRRSGSSGAQAVTFGGAGRSFSQSM